MRANDPRVLWTYEQWDYYYGGGGKDDLPYPIGSPRKEAREYIARFVMPLVVNELLPRLKDIRLIKPLPITPYIGELSEIKNSPHHLFIASFTSTLSWVGTVEININGEIERINKVFTLDDPSHKEWLGHELTLTHLLAHLRITAEMVQQAIDKLVRPEVFSEMNL